MTTSLRSVSVRFSAFEGLEHFSLFGRAKIGVNGRKNLRKRLLRRLHDNKRKQKTKQLGNNIENGIMGYRTSKQGLHDTIKGIQVFANIILQTNHFTPMIREAPVFL